MQNVSVFEKKFKFWHHDTVNVPLGDAEDDARPTIMPQCFL